jgi:hypothetical protein
MVALLTVQALGLLLNVGFSTVARSQWRNCCGHSQLFLTILQTYVSIMSASPLLLEFGLHTRKLLLVEETTVK